MLRNVSSAEGLAQVDRSADRWDDDWLWGRGTESNRTRPASFGEVLCVPRTLKNVACRYSADDSGLACDRDLAFIASALLGQTLNDICTISCGSCT